MKIIYTFFLLIFIGCAHCSNDPEPYIRTQPGSEYCQPMCDLFKQLDCKPYYEDIVLEDGGIMTCYNWCLYELQHSVPLNSQCIVENLKSCDQIENICK